MKRIIALLLALIMCFSMVACDMLGGDKTGGTNDGGNTDGGNTDNGNTDSGNNNGGSTAQKVTYTIPEGGYDGSEVTITFSHTMNAGYQEVLDKYIAEFNKLYPNIHVEHSQVGGYDEVRDTIKTELTAGMQPNIAYCYPDHVALYNVTKKVVPLDAFIESTIEVTRADGSKEILGLTAEQLADFIPGYYAEGSVFDAAGTMYTLPMSKSTEVLYYNKAVFAELGLKVPTTWDEVEACCEAIKNSPKYKDCTPLGYDSEANWFITMCEQQNSPYTSTDSSDHFVFNTKANREFVKRFREWYQKGYLTTKELAGAYTSGLFTAESLFMCIGSSGGASYQCPEATDNGYAFNVGVAPIPQLDAKDPAAISQGPSLCIFDQTNKQEVVASWLFVEFLTTNADFQAAFSKRSGYMPVINSAKDVKVYKDWLAEATAAKDTDECNDYLQALAIQIGIDQTDAYFVSPAFNGSSEARDQVGALMQYCFATPVTSGTVDDFINDAFKAAVTACIEKS